MRFKLKRTLNNGVRVGEIETAHGKVSTSFFMPVGTKASVKGISPQELTDLGAQIVLSNTYHLYLRPGEKLIKKLGGLHKFMGWDGPILTDSGGYQVFSQSENKYQNFKIKNQNDKDCHSRPDRESNKVYGQLSVDSCLRRNDINNQAIEQPNNESLVRVTTDGVEFKSFLDGSKHFFTPEKVIQIQLDLGVDILMPLDVCPSGKASAKEIEKASLLSIVWAKRAKKYFDKKMKNISRDMRPALFGIVQGGLDLKLRKRCAMEMIELGFEGYSVGGLAVDHETRDMWKTVELMGKILPEDKPRYLMGVGTPDDIIKATKLGMDMFDCVLPTRLARHGVVFVHEDENSKLETLIRQSADKQRGVIAIHHQAEKQSLKQYQQINLLNTKYRTDPNPIEKDCKCPACAGGFSRAYISHLIRENEMFGLRLTTLHNLHVYLDLMRKFLDSMR